MSNSVDNAFIMQYEREVHDIFQRKGGFLRPTVRMKTGVVGKSTTFQVAGKGTATTKARNGVITPMNVDHTPVECTLEDFYAGDWVDKLDEAKTNIDERGVIARAGAFALGRKVDEQIITKLETTTETEIDWVQTSSAAIRNSMLKMGAALDDNDVSNDGDKYGLLSPQAWAAAMTVEEFSNSQFVGSDGLPFTKGTAMGISFVDWNGVKWQSHTGVDGKGTSASSNYVYHKTAVGYATGAHANNNAVNDVVAADITWHGDRASHFVNHSMSGGACLIDGTGVIKGTFDDTAALPTT